MIYVQIAESIEIAQGLPPVDSALLEKAARQVLAQQKVEGEATLVLSDDPQLHELNRQFRNIDSPTDVLSFPDGEIDPETQLAYLGDVLISYPRALAQATAGGHSLSDELQLLVVHGMLHLLGHDHADEQAKAAMWTAQADILEQLGCTLRP
jgi:probable rRNA maturation factor